MRPARIHAARPQADHVGSEANCLASAIGSGRHDPTDPCGSRHGPGTAPGVTELAVVPDIPSLRHLACDFVHVDTVFLKGFTSCSSWESRRAACTCWASPRTRPALALFSGPRTLVMDMGERVGGFRFLIRDRDSKFSRSFDQVFAASGMRISKTSVRSPWTNAFAERFVGTPRRECPDHLLIHGERHLRMVLAEYECHFNDHRPHQGRSPRPPLHDPSEVIDRIAGATVERTVTELISEYRRAA